MLTIGTLVGCAASDRDDLAGSHVPPVLSVNGVALQPISYTWYSMPDGTIRRQRPQDHPSSPEDFPVVAMPGSGDLVVEIPTLGRPDKIDITYFTSVDRDGQPEQPLRTVQCATDPECRWDDDGTTGRLTVPAAPEAGFAAIELAIDVPDFPSALPVRSSARYGVVLQDRQR